MKISDNLISYHDIGFGVAGAPRGIRWPSQQPTNNSHEQLNGQTVHEGLLPGACRYSARDLLRPWWQLPVLPWRVLARSNGLQYQLPVASVACFWSVPLFRISRAFEVIALLFLGLGPLAHHPLPPPPASSSTAPAPSSPSHYNPTPPTYYLPINYFDE